MTVAAGVIDVGSFPMRRYRLSTSESSLTVLAWASCQVAWVDDRMRVRFFHGPGHVLTTQWLEDQPLGAWITVHGWDPPRMPPIPTDGLWTTVHIKTQLRNRSDQGFVGFREDTPGPGYVISRSEPPITAGAAGGFTDTG